MAQQRLLLDVSSELHKRDLELSKLNVELRKAHTQRMIAIATAATAIAGLVGYIASHIH